MDQLAQIAGAILILAAYVLAQLGLVRNDARSYLLLNLVGAAILTVDAWRGRQWGFTLLEGVWTLVTLWSLVTTRRPGGTIA